MKQLLQIIVSIALLFLISVSGLVAQVRPYVRAGVGASWADLRGRASIDVDNGPFYWGALSEADKTNPILTGGFGLGVQLDLGNHLLLQIETNVEQKGYHSSVEAFYSGCSRCTVYEPAKERPATGNMETRLTYLTFPILAGYKYGKWTVLAGPYAAFTLNASQRVSYQSSFDNIYNTINDFEQTTKAFSRPDFGLTTGLSYTLLPALELQLRYNRSLLSAKSSDKILADQERVYNQTAQVGLSYNLLR